jgi:hypothetical protein
VRERERACEREREREEEAVWHGGVTKDITDEVADGSTGHRRYRHHGADVRLDCLFVSRTVSSKRRASERHASKRRASGASYHCPNSHDSYAVENGAT